MSTSAAWLSVRETKLRKLQLSAWGSRPVSPGLEVDLSEAFESGASSDVGEDAVESAHASRKFLDLFTHDEIRGVMQREGVLDALAAKGFHTPRLAFDVRGDLHRQVVTHTVAGSDATIMLIDCWMRRRKLYSLETLLSYQLVCRLDACGSWDALGEHRMRYMSVELARNVRAFLEKAWPRAQKASKRGNSEIDVVEISWLQMQQPLLEPTEDRPLLPGQRFPGLGLAKPVNAALLSMASSAVHCDGYSNAPLAWVNAIYYQRDGHKALSPAFDAYIEWSSRQLQPVVAQHGLAFVCWAWANGHMRRRRADGSVEAEIWDAEDQILPTGVDGNDAFSGFFASRTWQSLRQRALDEMASDSLFIDIEAAPEIWCKSRDPALRARAER